MTTKVEKSILVNVPLSVAYNQWTQFEEFPHFMSGVKSVTQLDDEHLNWVAEIAGVRRQWNARILEQVPDKKISWAATEGATNAGSVTFEDVGGGQTQVHLVLEYKPEGLVEKIGDKLNVVENKAEGDLDRFKAFIESEGYATGAWRGSVGTGTAADEPGIETAAASRVTAARRGSRARSPRASASQLLAQLLLPWVSPPASRTATTQPTSHPRLLWTRVRTVRCHLSTRLHRGTLGIIVRPPVPRRGPAAWWAITCTPATVTSARSTRPAIRSARAASRSIPARGSSAGR